MPLQNRTTPTKHASTQPARASPPDRCMRGSLPRASRQSPKTQRHSQHAIAANPPPASSAARSPLTRSRVVHTMHRHRNKPTSCFFCCTLSWIPLTARVDSSARRVTLASELLLWSVTCIGDTIETTWRCLQASSGAAWRDWRILRLAQQQQPLTSTWGNATHPARSAPSSAACVALRSPTPNGCFHEKKQTGKRKGSSAPCPGTLPPAPP